MMRVKQAVDLVGLGDVVEMTRRQVFAMGILLGLLPQERPKKKQPGSGGLLLIWN